MKNRLTVLFHRFGPYHLARLEAAARVCELTALELGAESAEYAWEKVSGARGFQRVTLFPHGDSREAAADEVRSRVRAALEEARPEAVAIPGWSDRAAFVALAWCAEQGVPAIVMSESTAHDEPRVGWKEFVKRRLVRLFSTALVGGRLHVDYLEQLGMSRDRIFTGYDVVENKHFAGAGSGERGAGSGAAKVEIGKVERGNEPEGKAESGKRKAEISEAQISACGISTPHPGPLPGRGGEGGAFFLASARFIEKKNLPRLLQAYAQYRDAVKAEIGKAESGNERTAASTSPRPSPQGGEGVAPWGLVLLGDGPLRPALCSQLQALGLQDSVLMPGFIQYDELPAWYARASAFVHASTTEQWGLVVNEAVAAGLPVMVSNRCGCAPELVREGVNGFTFDPNNVEEFAALLLKISAFNFPLSAFGAESRSIATQHEPARFGEGLKQAAELAMKLPRPRANLFDRLLLNRLASG